MSTQLKGKKRRGATMSSKAKNTKGDASEDALPTESALLGPENPTNSGGGAEMNKKRRWLFQKKQMWKK